jgi:hypothetical protein
MAYTTNDNGQEFFQADLYTGTGNTGATLARTFDGNVDLNPGLLYMFKRTSGGNMHNIMTNEILGTGSIWLSSSGDSAADGILDSFDSDGYTHATANQGTYYHNENAKEYGVWAWKDMAASSANNTDGTITSSVRTDANLGLSYVRWTGTSADGTIGHGLGKRPKAIWMYPVQVAANNGNTNRIWWWEANSWNHVINNALNASQNSESDSTNGRVGAFNSSSQGTSSVFSVFSGNSSYEGVNHSSQDYLALVWTDVQGFSKFSSYKGNGNANGAFVYTGFKPALIMIRGMHATGTRCFDYRRDPDNQDDGHFVGVNDAQSEISDANTKIDILSNGFKIRCSHTGLNASGNKYGFCAWAENPFVTSTGTPTTAR